MMLKEGDKAIVKNDDGRWRSMLRLVCGRKFGKS